ncbi:MAG: hypothetical protein B7Z61_08660 [Acidobacteria bacterium 37-71-11]|nr:MAG: hypothetical protein B7Z61_08660 [Acidobacteria bacterium 37-71-11]
MAVAVAAAATVARGKDLKIASTWVAAAVPVDGTPGAWAPLLRPLGDPPLVIGVQNDGRYLYLCLRTSDPIIKRQLAHLGLTVWLNGGGKDSKGFGVHYPVGMGPRGVRWQPGQGEPPEGEETRRANSDRVANEVELIGPTKDDRQPVQLGPDEPVQAALGDDSGVMVLEMRVPLQPTEGHPLAVGAVPGATIALGLATERPKAGARGRVRLGGGGESGEGGPGDESGIGRGRGGFGGRGGYGGRGGMGGGMRDRGMSGGVTPAPLDVWLRVTLAKGPAQTPAS